VSRCGRAGKQGVEGQESNFLIEFGEVSGPLAAAPDRVGLAVSQVQGGGEGAR